MVRNNLIFFLLSVFEVIFVIFDLHFFHHIIIPFIITIYLYLYNLHESLKLFAFYILSFWVIFKNNCILSIYKDKKIVHIFSMWLLLLSGPLAIIISTFKSFSFYNKILLFYSFAITNFKFNKIHNSNLRYINLIILYFIFF